MQFVKMHGLGNDFVILDHRLKPYAITESQVQLMADRRFGIGCDQLIVLLPPQNPQADVLMQIYNADGSLSGMCGNAARCVIGLLGQDAVIETSGGLYKGTLGTGNQSSIDMGLPKRTWQSIPMSEACDTDRVKFPELNISDGVAVNVGNPHVVFFVDDVDAVDLVELGPQIENHPFFPERTNVEFVQVIAPDHLKMRVWERGAGITQACGTGATASFIAARIKGVCEAKAKVEMPGGILILAEDQSNHHVIQTGEWTKVFEGVLLDASLSH